jgi:ferredoxin-nitrite reductase
MPAKQDLTQVERDKLTINPDFDFKNDIAARPFEDLTTNDIGMFKWSGIYHQLQKGFFMMRLRIPGGIINAEQMEVVARIAEKYGQNQVCITTRMTFQFHWLRKEDLYK